MYQRPREIDGFPNPPEDDEARPLAPFFRFEGGRWAYRRWGLGQPVSVSEEEMRHVSQVVRGRARKLGAGIAIGLLAILFIWSKWSGDEEFSILGNFWGNLLIGLGPILMAAVLYAPLVHRHMRHSDIRPRFGPRVGVGQLAKELVVELMPRAVLKPRDLLYFLLLSLPLLFLIATSAGFGPIVFVGGITLAWVAAVIMHRVTEAASKEG